MEKKQTEKEPNLYTLIPGVKIKFKGVGTVTPPKSENERG